MMKPEYDILTKQIKTMGYSFGHSRYIDKGVIGYCVDALSADGHRYVVAADDLIDALKGLVKMLHSLAACRPEIFHFEKPISIPMAA